MQTENIIPLHWAAQMQIAEMEMVLTAPHWQLCLLKVPGIKNSKQAAGWYLVFVCGNLSMQLPAPLIPTGYQNSFLQKSLTAEFVVVQIARIKPALQVFLQYVTRLTILYQTYQQMLCL